MTTVSVVIAAYNAEHHLERAVRSALDQTLSPLEILVVDDASTDDTVGVVRRLRDASPIVRGIALHRNGGPAAARNAALDQARGEWVAVLDADDAYTPGRLAALVALGGRHDADVVLDNFLFRNAETDQLRPSRITGDPLSEPMVLHRFLAGARAFNFAPTWTLLKPMVRRSFLESHGLRYPTHSRHGEDFLFMVELLLSGAAAVRTGAAGYLYTERAQGASTTRLDYRGLVEQSEQLLTDPRLASDPRARRLLRARLGTLRLLAAHRQGRTAVLRAITDPYVVATLSRRAARRVGRLGRAPDQPPMPALL